MHLPGDQREKPIKLDATVPEAVEFLRDVSSANIWLNWRALQEHVKKGETRVNAELTPTASLEASLKTFLAGIDTRTQLDFAYVNGLIVISTKEDVEKIKALKPVQHAR